MDFDHVRGVKFFNIAGGSAANRRFASVVAETEKCDLVCANCHRIRTWNRSHDWVDQI